MTVKNIQSILLLTFIVVGVLEVAGLYTMRRHDGLYRFVPVKNFDDLDYTYPSQTPDEFKQFAGSSTIEIMQNVMNFVNKKHNGRWRSEHIQDLYNHAKNGGGLTCNGISELFIHALRIQGYKARKVFVVKDIGNPWASHTVVEVYQEGKWRVYDPTFGVCFSKNTQFLGATDIALSLMGGSFKSINPLFYGNNAHQQAFENYHIYWLAHFNNVLLFKHGDYSKSWFVRNILQLPLRYWWGPTLYYFAPFSSNRHLELLDWFYFIFACIGPLTLIFLGTLLFLLYFLSFKNKHK